MPSLPEMISEYRAIVSEEAQLDLHKKELRAAILGELDAQRAVRYACESGTAYRDTRFKLISRPDRILQVLSASDILPFARFTPKGVKELLVPKYGREKLVPLFDVEKQIILNVRAPLAASAREEPAPYGGTEATGPLGG